MFKSKLRLYLIAYVFGILCVSAAISGLITSILNLFVTYTVIVPAFVWMLVFSVLLGTGITAYLSKWIIAPVTNLSDAMNRVAAGDFTTSLQSSSKIPEIRDMYAKFNLMVKDLKAIETLQSDFVSNVSHEFKTPISAIEGYATLLQDQNQTNDEQQEYVGKIISNTHRLTELVSNILLISKVENQIERLEKNKYRLDEQIRQSILFLEPKWSCKNIEFDVDMDTVIYLGNEGLMRHVWNNLIDNAVKFNPFGGYIRIRLREYPQNIVFSIEDNGPGISEAGQKHIYDKFYQDNDSHRFEGNGLGLALVKRILDASAGTIQVQSKTDCGCRFIVTLRKEPA